jgi:hypothetical protein
MLKSDDHHHSKYVGITACHECIMIISVSTSSYVQGGNIVNKVSKSKRFGQQSADSVKKHDDRFPYRSTFSDSIRKKTEADNHTVGGF